MRRLLLYGLLAMLTVRPAFSQDDTQPASYTVRDGRMYIRIEKKIDKTSLDKFVDKFDLSDLSLGQAILAGRFSRLARNGWRIEVNNVKRLVISKEIGGVDQLRNPARRMELAEGHPNPYDLFPSHNDDLVYGFNRFIGKYPFAVQELQVTFYLKGHGNARKVLLAGSFTNWQYDALPMTHTDSGWIAIVPLDPGKYWYKFIVDGRWMTDPDNRLRETDPEGNENSVYYKPNVTFRLTGHTANKDAFLSGSFNNWNPGELPMQKDPTGWTIQLYLADGTHTYKFVVDGKWTEDPANSERVADGQKGFNSILRLGKPHVFELKGYTGARNVTLCGNFNDWRPNEWHMRKTPDGWVLPYTLGPGNYEYRFNVDGKSIADPANPLFVNDRHLKTTNSYLIIQPNYSFRLTGYPDAKEISLAGDFNNWTPGALKMSHAGNTWSFDIHLSTGKHLYKFVVDGHWTKDPENPLWEENEYNTDNSVLWMEEK